MKGQARIINELLLFGIGAMLALSVASTLSYAVNTFSSRTQGEQYSYVGNMVSMAIVKSFICGKQGQCEIMTRLPEKISEERYIISFSGNNVSIIDFKTREMILSRLPTIDEISMLSGSATSSAEYIVIASNQNSINISREW